MQLTVNGVSSPRAELPVTLANPSLFTIPDSYQINSQEFVALALNADGSVNSQSNPAQPGSVVSVFVNGLVPDPRIPGPPLELFTYGDWSVMVPANQSVRSGSESSDSLDLRQFCVPSECLRRVFKIFDLNSYLVAGSPFNMAAGWLSEE